MVCCFMYIKSPDLNIQIFNLLVFVMLIWIILMIILCLFVMFQYKSSNISQTGGFKRLPVSRSVELYNPSIYSGMYVSKRDVPLFYTRTNLTYPLHNQLSITKQYHYPDHPKDNMISALWNVPNIYPLRNRRTMLI